MSEKTQIQLGVVGAFLIFIFLFLPIAPARGFNADTGGTIFLISAKGEQWGIFALSLVAAFCVYRDALSWAIADLCGLYLCTLSAFLRPVMEHHFGYYHRDTYWFGFAGPGFMHWVILSSGLVLLTVSIVTGWQMLYGRRTSVQLRGASTHKAQSKPSASVSRVQINRPSLGDVAGSIDWGWWGIVLLSFTIWPLGILLHFAFSRSGDDKGDAAIIGAGLGLGLMVLRFVLTMAKVGGTP